MDNTDQPLNEEIKRILTDAGWPDASPLVFTGTVVIAETMYPPRTTIVDAIANDNERWTQIT